MIARWKWNEKVDWKGEMMENKTNCGSLNNRSEHEFQFSRFNFTDSREFFSRSTKTKWSFMRMKRIDCWNRNFGVTSGNYTIIVNILSCSDGGIPISFLLFSADCAFLSLTVYRRFKRLNHDQRFLSLIAEWRFSKSCSSRHLLERSQELDIPKRSNCQEE